MLGLGAVIFRNPNLAAPPHLRYEVFVFHSLGRKHNRKPNCFESFAYSWREAFVVAVGNAPRLRACLPRQSLPLLDRQTNHKLVQFALENLLQLPKTKGLVCLSEFPLCRARQRKPWDQALSLYVVPMSLGSCVLQRPSYAQAQQRGPRSRRLLANSWSQQWEYCFL